jgi:hypothetical protein
MLPPKDETELHVRVVDYIRVWCVGAVLVAGLGELQRTRAIREMAYKKGYTRGQSDLILLNQTSRFGGLAIELKHPNGGGKLRPSQSAFLSALTSQGFDTLVSCSYDEVIAKVVQHMEESLLFHGRKQLT